MLNILGHEGNANQNNTEISSHSIQKWAIINKTNNNNAGKDVSEKETLYIVGTNVN
jgi:hypothetical protein